MESRPRIGVSGESIHSKSVQAMMQRLWAAGAEPVFLDDPSTRDVGEDIRSLDGIAIMGSNSDIDPRQYGDRQLHPKTKVEPTPDRARYENALIEASLFYGVPLVGVCVGMQRINTANAPQGGGGTLHQDVVELTGHKHWQDEPGYVPVQVVGIQQGSRLSQIAGNITGVYVPGPGANYQLIKENMFHHQAVKDVRKGFRATAFSDDGLVEAIEPDPNGPYANNYVVGVQWHPEFGASPFGDKLVHDLVGHAHAFGKQRDAQLQGGFAAGVREERERAAAQPRTLH